MRLQADLGILFIALVILCCPHPVYLLLAISIHELSHVICALSCRSGLPRLFLDRAGIRLLYSTPKSTARALAICLSGPLCGALPFFVFPLPRPLRLYCLGLSLINLIPLSCLDGGGALHTVLEHFFHPQKAHFILKAISAASALLLWALTVAVSLKAAPNPSLIILCTSLTISALSDTK